MSRKLVVALFALLLAVVTAWADPGGEGGCVNLPGGRSGSRPGASSTGSPFQITVSASVGVSLVLPDEIRGAAALVRGVDLPFAFWLATIDGSLHLPGAILTGLRRSGEVGFSIDFVNHLGARLPVQFRFGTGDQLLVSVF